MGDDTDMSAIWQDLYQVGVDVVLNGHTHAYERFAPQRPDEVYDPAAGIREFVVGTGGEDFHPFTTSKFLAESRDDATFGVLMLTLHASSYDLRFASVAGQSFTDAGSGYCH